MGQLNRPLQPPAAAPTGDTPSGLPQWPLPAAGVPEAPTEDGPSGLPPRT